MATAAVKIDFFLVGAQKAATSTLDYMLEQHPDLFLPEVKEPCLVAAQFWNLPFNGPGDRRLEAYIADSPEKVRKLYAGILPHQLAGDASTSNLYYWKQAIPLIQDQFGDVPIIICLRNPVDRAYSAYMHMRRDMRESLSFEDALQQEEWRRRENWSFIWFYKEVGDYYEQVKAYLERFSRVKIVLFEDIRSDAVQVARSCYAFLGVDASFEPSLDAPVNASGEPDNRLLHALLFKPGKVKGTLMKAASRLFTARRVNAAVERMRSANLKRVDMDPETRRVLMEAYRENIVRLEGLIQRDLSEWIK